MACRLAFGLALLAASLVSISAISFYLEPGHRQCFTEELPSLSKITGEAKVTSGKSDMEIDVWITTMDGNVLYHKRAADHGKFTFRTPSVSKQHDDVEEDEYDYGQDDDEEDTFKICIEHQQHPSRAHPTGTHRLVSFKLHQSFNGGTSSLEDAATASDTDKLEASMRDIHTALSGMIGDLSQLQRRERVLTARMQRTTTRITSLAIFAVIVTMVTSAFQFKYYKGYFKQKKLC